MPRKGRVPRIARAEDLPPCFDLKAYDVGPLTAADWEVNLFTRLHHAHQAVPSGEIEALIKTPVLRFQGGYRAGNRGMGRSEVMVLLHQPPVPNVELPVQPTRGLGEFAVEPVGMPDILSAFNALAERVPRLRSALTDVRNSSQWMKLEATVVEVAQTYDERPAAPHVNVAFLKVDLVLSDREITEDFRHALRAARSRLGVEPTARISRADLAKLHKHRVLPYLDLTAWARAQGRRINNDILADALLGRKGPTSAEMVRKTIKKHAEDALKPAFLLRLHVEALREVRRKKSDRWFLAAPLRPKSR